VRRELSASHGSGAWRGTVSRDHVEDGPGSAEGAEGDTTAASAEPAEAADAMRAGTPTAMADSPGVSGGGAGMSASDPAHGQAERVLTVVPNADDWAG